MVEPKRPPMPTIARYPGMPADRYWEFEDGRVNFGMLGAAKTDLARLAVIEYALVFGNDWFTLPVTLPVNALYQRREARRPRQLRDHGEDPAGDELGRLAVDDVRDERERRARWCRVRV